MEELRRGAERMGERATAAREAVEDRATAAKEATAEAIALVKPKLRGVSHKWAIFASLILGAALILLADTPKATFAVGVYAVSLSDLFGTSALNHGVQWSLPDLRLWMRRLDHSMIFFLIAGTYTPFALLVLHGTLAMAILAVVWIGAVAGAAFPELWTAMGVAGTLLVAFGGLLYTAGAVVYATQRPNPNPAVFGYHEVFHLFVIVAAIAQ